MSHVRDVAVLGAGVIGASWAALFLAAGCRVAIFDPAEGTEQAVRKYIDGAWLTLDELGLIKTRTRDQLRFCNTATEAVK
ncbi:MAG: hypothetical protein JOZ12_10070, partial [Sinobacteraceae bacterium]|nr:hypothetical protein [Nevskiaceae bacterium]